MDTYDLAAGDATYGDAGDGYGAFSREGGVGVDVAGEAAALGYGEFSHVEEAVTSDPMYDNHGYTADYDPYGTADPAYFRVEPDSVIEGVENPEYFEQQNRPPEGKDSGYMAVKPDWLEDQWDLLSTQPWFRGDLDRTGAIKVLKGAAPGTFCVRISSVAGHYAISTIQYTGKIIHMLILPSWAGEDSTAPGNTRYRLGTTNTLLFNTVPKLCAYYIAHPYLGRDRLAGTVVPEEQDGGYLDVHPDI